MRTLWHTQLSTTSRSVVIRLLSSHVYRVYTLHDSDRIVKSGCQLSRDATAWCATPDQPSRPATLHSVAHFSLSTRPYPSTTSTGRLSLRVIGSWAYFETQHRTCYKRGELCAARVRLPPASLPHRPQLRSRLRLYAACFHRPP